jgi:hypothetical protein
MKSSSSREEKRVRRDDEKIIMSKIYVLERHPRKLLLHSLAAIKNSTRIFALGLDGSDNGVVSDVGSHI